MIALRGDHHSATDRLPDSISGRPVRTAFVAESWLAAPCRWRRRALYPSGVSWVAARPRAAEWVTGSRTLVIPVPRSPRVGPEDCAAHRTETILRSGTRGRRLPGCRLPARARAEGAGPVPVGAGWEQNSAPHPCRSDIILGTSDKPRRSSMSQLTVCRAAPRLLRTRGLGPGGRCWRGFRRRGVPEEK